MLWSENEVLYPMPRIHVYAFSKDMDDPISDVVHRVAGVLQCDVSDLNYADPSNTETIQGHIVRDVSPRKVMVCLSFVLPSKVRCILAILFFVLLLVH